MLVCIIVVFTATDRKKEKETRVWKVEIGSVHEWTSYERPHTK